MSATTQAFLRTAGRILNSGQARTLLLTGNIYDLFCQETGETEEYVPLLGSLTANWSLPGLIVVVYELNGPIRFVGPADADALRDAWLKWRSGLDANALAIKRMVAKGAEAEAMDRVVETYDDSLRKAVNNPTLALELLRQFCLCSRTVLGGKRLLDRNLLILIEGADLILPDAPIPNLSDVDRQRVAICHDWFSDPGFVNGGDSVVLMAESRSLLHQRIARLPQLLEVEIPSPDDATRRHFISWFNRSQPEAGKIRLWSTQRNWRSAPPVSPCTP